MSRTSEPTPVTCEDCGWSGTSEDLLVKMGGLLCPKCRYIVMYPDDGRLTIPVTQEGGQFRSHLRSKDYNDRQP